MSTPEQRAKWREQKRGKRAAEVAVEVSRSAARVKTKGVQHDAIIYLRHAEREINKELREGKVKKLGKAALLTLLALSALQGCATAPPLTLGCGGGL